MEGCASNRSVMRVLFIFCSGLLDLAFYKLFRSPPDGEMSHEIARASYNLARDISLLTSKTLQDSITSSEDVTSHSMLSTITPSDKDSLEHNAVVVESPPAATRRTWNSGTSALDNLMLSNVCALSSRLTTVADSVVAKIEILHSGTPSVDLSKSKVPLLQQTASQEMAAIVNNLRKVEMQLLRADEIIDPEKKLQNLFCN